ncbi:MAG: nucleotidyltransferase domain-containing protein [Pseudomonadota bacterium]
MTKGIRLKDSSILAIQDLFRKHFKSEDHIWLFGSRSNLDAKGGDIDLYIETTIPNYDIAIDKKFVFLADLRSRIGDQQIDIVLRCLSSNSILSIYDVAKSEGVLLV